MMRSMIRPLANANSGANFAAELCATPGCAKPGRWHETVKWSVSPIAYLRAAQAYMLISMPTGSSTIFGAFQAISLSLGPPVLAAKVARNAKFASKIFAIGSTGLAAAQPRLRVGMFIQSTTGDSDR
jgi:hypothetical protein